MYNVFFFNRTLDIHSGVLQVLKGPFFKSARTHSIYHQATIEAKYDAFPSNNKVSVHSLGKVFRLKKVQ